MTSIASRFFTVTKLAGLSLGGLLVALVAAETLLRTVGFEFPLYPSKLQFGYPSPHIIQTDYRPDKDLLWVNRDYADRLAALRKVRRKLIFIGDSCTALGHFPQVTAELVRQHSGQTGFHQAKLAVTGWSSYQGLQQLKRDVLPLKPDYLVIYFGWNDHWKSFGYTDKEIGQFKLFHSPWLLALSNLRLVQLVNKAFLQKAFSVPSLNDTPERVSLTDYRHNLTTMVRLARNHGITPLLVTAPSSHQPGKEPQYLAKRWLSDLSTLVPIHRRYNAVVRSVSREEDVILVDAARYFDSLPEPVRRRAFWRDGIHLSPSGNHLMAEQIAAALLNVMPPGQ